MKSKKKIETVTYHVKVPKDVSNQLKELSVAKQRTIHNLLLVLIRHGISTVAAGNGVAD